MEPAQPPRNVHQRFVTVSPSRPGAPTSDSLHEKIGDNRTPSSSIPNGSRAPSKPRSRKCAIRLATDPDHEPATRPPPSTSVAPSSKPPSSRSSPMPARLSEGCYLAARRRSS
jgi:hypothetical protein